MNGNYLWPESISIAEYFVCTSCLESVFCYPRCMPPKHCRLCFYRHLRYVDGYDFWNLPEDFETQEAFEEHKAKLLARDTKGECHEFVNRREFEDSEAHIKGFLEYTYGTEKDVLASNGTES